MSFKKCTAEFIYSFKTSSSEPIIFQALRTQRWVRQSLLCRSVQDIERDGERWERSVQRDVVRVSKLAARAGSLPGEAGRSKPSQGLVHRALELKLSWKATASPCRVSSSFGHSQVFGCGRGKGDGHIWARRDKDLNEGREGVSGGSTRRLWWGWLLTEVGNEGKAWQVWRERVLGGMAGVKGTHPGRHGRVLVRDGLWRDAGDSLTRGRRSLWTFSLMKDVPSALRIVVVLRDWWKILFLWNPREVPLSLVTFWGHLCCILLFKSRRHQHIIQGLFQNCEHVLIDLGLWLKAWVP